MLSNLKDENSKTELINSIREVDFVNLSNVKKINYRKYCTSYSYRKGRLLWKLMI